LITKQTIEYDSSYEAASLMMAASNNKNHVIFENKNEKALKFIPFLPANCEMVSAQQIIERPCRLLQFQDLAKDLKTVTGLDCWEYLSTLWTYAYYTGNPEFCADDVFFAVNGNSYQTLPVFNYVDAFTFDCDHESIKPPERAFQVNWHSLALKAGTLHKKPAFMDKAIIHFTIGKYYR